MSRGNSPDVDRDRQGQRDCDVRDRVEHFKRQPGFILSGERRNGVTGALIYRRLLCADPQAFR